MQFDETNSGHIGNKTSGVALRLNYIINKLKIIQDISQDKRSVCILKYDDDDEKEFDF